jgi:holo-[acyl-carrier protein] synthase
MIRLGTDIVYIPRIQAVIKRFGKRFLERVYTPNEQQNSGYDENIPTRASINKLAGRWAAKEAVVKALGTGWQGVGYTDVEICRLKSGMPYVTLYNNAAVVAAALELEKNGEIGEAGGDREIGRVQRNIFTSPPSPTSPHLPTSSPPQHEWQLSLSHDGDYAIATAIFIAIDTQTTLP